MESAFKRDVARYEPAIRKRALEAFRDDLGSGDATTEAVITQDRAARAVIEAEGNCTLAGILEAKTIFEDGGLKVTGKKDGDEARKGETILTIEGSVKELLARERTALNYLARMSGMATLSRQISKKHGHRVLFLRKVDPGLLFSEKRAVAAGGCLTHRMNLADGILIKDNHLKALWALSGDKTEAVEEAVKRASKNRRGNVPIEIEVETLEQARAAAKALDVVIGTRVIMLDNMPPSQVRKAGRIIRGVDDSIIIEASGGITRPRIGDYLKAGADYVSTSIFLAAKPCRFRMEMK